MIGITLKKRLLQMCQVSGFRCAARCRRFKSADMSAHSKSLPLRINDLVGLRSKSLVYL
jgi:hypothetical protein